MEGISYREFSRRVGVSPEAVRKAVATGRIPPEALGTTTLRSGRERPCIIDPELAAKHWGLSTNAAQQRDNKKISKGRKRAHTQARGEEYAPEDDGDVEAAPPKIRAGGKIPTQAESNAISAAYKARIAKLDYEERVGTLINAEQARIAFVKQIVEARSKLAGVGRMFKERAPHATIDDVMLIDELIAEALEEMSVGN